MNSSEMIDIDLLMDAAGDDQEIAAELVRLYFELTGKEMLRLEEAAKSGDFATVSAVAHKCAGSSISCGMRELSAMLKDLECQSAESMPADLPEQMEKIKAQMDAVQAVAENHFACSFAS